jgi:hypothetical protein
VRATDELPGISEGDMSITDSQRKHGTTGGSPRRSRLTHSEGISYKPQAAKSRCACQWGAWGRLSDDGSGHYNPDRSEGPWGRAAAVARTEVFQRVSSLDSERGTDGASGEHEGRWQTIGRDDLVGDGKAPSEIPALKPY